jgi:hypothetical protein
MGVELHALFAVHYLLGTSLGGIAMAVVFDSGDGPYLTWLGAHPTGYVLNTERSYSPGYMVLHRASCPSISVLIAPARPGGFTERDYVKVCSDNVADLSAWVRLNGRPNGSFSKRCPRCDP